MATISIGEKSGRDRELRGGNICFVNCESWYGYATDDSHVPDDGPNLQGDDPFKECLAVKGLHPTQVEILWKSPLLLP